MTNKNTLIGKEPIGTCSFCGRPNTEMAALIAGMNGFICENCVDICVDILEDMEVRVKSSDAEEIDISELGIKPRFKTLSFQLRQDHCFHLSPFGEPFDTIYQDHLRSAARAAEFSIERADDIFGTEPIVEDIWRSINSAAVVTADVTGRNPNVMYEIGMAHTVGRPVIIMTQTMDDVPFDLKHYRCLVYEYTPRGCAWLEEKLAGTLRFLKGKKVRG